ncbi:ComEC/Rec2 family competence protein [Jannaschia sp. W003]|uniref:ComEC/Rec2 family competence protein n=1 Tax=Jannaschia sp. W003 TaxID=2867012 RepID=UPI0021A6105F|nr:ComEC/Rec2 family competence protein [Jannaschia sp. W003]UWQ20271.1 ComEC/Rec2 family competence protein [Jannaschia sp. W003]
MTALSGDITPPEGGASDRLAVRLHALRGRRLPWVAAAFGGGVALYFGLPMEPSPAVAGAMLLGAAMLAVSARLAWASVGLLWLLAAAVLAGALAAQLRTNLVASPVLAFRYYGPVEGRIVGIDRSGSGAPRLTLDRVRLDRMEPARTPRRVRISLQEPGALEPLPGMRVMTTVHLGPPPGPVEPGGFDFQRHVWFLGLGALGYGRAPLLLAEEAREGAQVARLRRHLAEGLHARMPHPAGAVAAAITTGDRSGLPEDAVEALRVSNLAHLLAISGLHMGLLVGCVFWLVRGGLALWPAVALRHPTRAWAALAALPVAAGYLAISGGGIATQRAFVMAVVMLGAILAGRRALSMRSVAIAALAVLLWRPESLVGPGFQMSFAATGALVLAFGWLRGADPRWRRGALGWVVALVISSLVAGLATAPIAAAHFGRVGHYGLVANMLAVPAMGAVVMPSMLAAFVLWPLGLEAPALAVAGAGIDWILGVARSVAAWPEAASRVPAPPAAVLPLVGAAMAWCAAAAGRWRAVALLPALAATWLWVEVERPAILVSDDGRLVGVLGPQGRALSHPRGAGFVAGAWLENDGDGAGQEFAAGRTPNANALAITVARGKRALAASMDGCTGIVVTDQPTPDAAPCRVIGIDALRRSGALSFARSGGGWVERSARAAQGRRPWTGHGRLWDGPGRGAND